MRSFALILCNGESPSRSLVRSLASRARLVVAADGGANAALACGVRPDVIIGDLDSITPATRRRFHRSLVIRVARQDNTDLEKALDFLLLRGIREVVIAGATGRRLDFTLGNVSLIWRYAGRMRISLEGDGWRAIPLERRASLRARRGTTVSLIPFGRCTGVTLRGLRYPLTRARLRIGDIAVSNVVTRSPFTISVTTGHMLLVLLTARGTGRSW